MGTPFRSTLVMTTPVDHVFMYPSYCPTSSRSTWVGGAWGGGAGIAATWGGATLIFGGVLVPERSGWAKAMGCAMNRASSNAEAKERIIVDIGNLPFVGYGNVANVETLLYRKDELSMKPCGYSRTGACARETGVGAGWASLCGGAWHQAVQRFPSNTAGGARERTL